MPFDSENLVRNAGLSAVAQNRLVNLFAEVNHRPSPGQWAAIRDLLDHLERAADGKLERAVYLSAIPAGTGKSAALATFAAALTDNPAYASVGILIAVSRKNEARDMATALRAQRDKLCVIMSDPDADELGAHETANEAQVCVCTQAAIKQTLKTLSGPFESAGRFHYRGARRAIVCWDESFAFNRPVTLDADAVTGLAKAVRRQSDAAANILKRWATELGECGATEGLRLVPDFKELGVNFHRLEEDVGDSDELIAQAKALAIISGGQGFATRGDYGAPTLITHHPELPPSLMPLVVTDASAKVNASYVQMAEKVPVRWLQDADKTYTNMTIRVVPTAASRSVYRDRTSSRGRELIEAAVRYVRSVGQDDVLVISYKSWMVIPEVNETTIRDAIDARLTDEEKRRVHHLTYGQHTATNDFKHVRRTILMGLNFMPRPTGHAAAGAALDLDLVTEHPTAGQIDAMRTGMLKDATLQAILRGHARMGRDGDCGEMEVVIFQTKQSGLSAEDYDDMFPGAKVERDNVLVPPQPLKGRLKELDEIVTKRLAAGETEMTNASLYDELGMSKQNFARLVKKAEWQAYVAALRLRPQRLNARDTGLRQV